ncbi:MAG TPA: hypothetical protein VG406_11735 [Isosphaeraceae bacterium]|jgi:hypothetical protein|nr:hypothetical protein [Isosphaeraceae bacterium]
MERNPEVADAADRLIPAPRRRRRLARELLPPIAILTIAGSILTYRALAPRWSGVGPVGWSRPAAEAAPAAPSGPSHLAGPGKLVVREQVAPKPEPKPEPKPVEPPAVALAKAEPEAAPPSAEPTVGAERVKAELAMEVEKRRKDEVEAILMKRAIAERGRREELRKAGKVETDPKTARDERREFLVELSRIVRAGGDRAAAQVLELRDRFRREPSPKTVALLERAHRGGLHKLGRDQKVAFYRRIGVPEPEILRILTRQEAFRVGTREGPRNLDDALLLAARQLLRVPLAPPNPAPPPDRPVARQ